MCYERRDPNIARECWERDQGVKAMNRLTRPGIHVDDSAARYIGNETRIQDVGDRLLEVILNGPTLTSFSKDRLRHMMRQLYARLEQYENTGVTPEEIEQIKTRIERVWKLLQDIDEEKLKHLEELVDAENEGRLVVLPCKLGDTVWILDHKFAAEIENISIGGEDGPCFEWTEYDRGFELTEVWDEGYFTEKDIGKTVFLTREEAEAAVRNE